MNITKGTTIVQILTRKAVRTTTDIVTRIRKPQTLKAKEDDDEHYYGYKEKEENKTRKQKTKGNIINKQKTERRTN